MTSTNLGAGEPQHRADTSSERPAPDEPRASVRYEEDPDHPEPTRWIGWIIFAGLMMILLGLFHAFQGFVALFREDYYTVGSSGLAIEVDYTTWGWIHLGLGLLIVATGIGLMVGQTWARVLGVVLMLVSALVCAGFMAALPIWSVSMIALCVLVIWAIVVHGRELKTYADRW
jgi:hypothetical protein